MARATLMGLGLVVGACSAHQPTPSDPPPASALRYQALSAPLVPPPEQPADTAIDARSVAADLDLLRHALERGYAGRRVVPEATYQTMLRELDALGSAPRSPHALCEALGDAFWPLPDAHLHAKERLAAGAHRLCGGRARAARRRPAVGAPYAAGDPSRPFAAGSLTVGRATVGVLALHAFPDATDPVWDGYDDAVASSLGAGGLIVDLRGNGGGDDARGLQLARALRDAAVGSSFVRAHERRTAEAITLRLNNLDLDARGPDGALAPWAQEPYAAARALREEAARQPTDDHVTDGLAAAPPGPCAYQRPLAILTDAACASSCESTLQALRRHPGARVFGERTAGYVNFGTIGTLRLPHSGVEVTIATRYLELEGGRSVDKVGFEPDVTVAPGTDALDAATAWVVSAGPPPSPPCAAGRGVRRQLAGDRGHGVVGQRGLHESPPRPPPASRQPPPASRQPPPASRLPPPASRLPPCTV